MANAINLEMLQTVLGFTKIDQGTITPTYDGEGSTIYHNLGEVPKLFCLIDVDTHFDQTAIGSKYEEPYPPNRDYTFILRYTNNSTAMAPRGGYTDALYSDGTSTVKSQNQYAYVGFVGFYADRVEVRNSSSDSAQLLAGRTYKWIALA